MRVYARGRVCYVAGMPTETPSLDDILARVASTSVEEMYTLADIERARLLRINSILGEDEEDEQQRDRR